MTEREFRRIARRMDDARTPTARRAALQDLARLPENEWVGWALQYGPSLRARRRARTPYLMTLLAIGFVVGSALAAQVYAKPEGWLVGGCLGLAVGSLAGLPLRVPGLAPLITAFDDPALLELWIAVLDDESTTDEVRELLYTRIARHLPDYWLWKERRLPALLVDSLAAEVRRIVSRRLAERNADTADEVTRQLRAVCTPTESAFLTALAVSLHADPNHGLPFNNDLQEALKKVQLVPVQGNVREAVEDAIQRLGRSGE